MQKKCILYLRTDICDEELTMGGSVGHTVGVINGFIQEGYDVVCASSCMLPILSKLPLTKLVSLENPKKLKFLRWKINCLLSSLFFFSQTKQLLNTYEVTAIYQRYSLLNVTGLLLSWWCNTELILEYNGSEVWVAKNWAAKKRLVDGSWIIALIEKWNITHADYVIVVSEVLKQELMERGIAASKVLVNPNGVDPLVFTPKVIKKECEV